MGLPVSGTPGIFAPTGSHHGGEHHELSDGSGRPPDKARNPVATKEA
jgi:hypothetical protein